MATADSQPLPSNSSTAVSLSMVVVSERVERRKLASCSPASRRSAFGLASSWIARSNKPAESCLSRIWGGRTVYLEAGFLGSVMVSSS